MSILTKPLFGTKAKTASSTTEVAQVTETATAPPPEKPSKQAKPGRAGTAPMFLTSPRADLLPPEILANHRKRGVRRGLRLMVVAGLVVALLASGGAFALAVATGIDAESEQREAQTLLAEKGAYAELQSTQQGIALLSAARRVGVSTEIDWADYVLELEQTLPGEVALTDIAVDSAGIEQPYVQTQGPLAREHSATITFTAESPVLPQIPDWVDRLSALPGFAGATVDAVNLAEGVYTATVTMRVDSTAFANRFVEEEQE